MLERKIPEALLQQYQASIPDKLEALRMAIETLHSEVTIEHLKALHFLLHKNAGSAGTYGYFRVSQLCFEWQEKLSHLIETFPKCMQDLTWQKELDLLVDKLLSAWLTQEE